MEEKNALSKLNDLLPEAIIQSKIFLIEYDDDFISANIMNSDAYLATNLQALLTLRSMHAKHIQSVHGTLDKVEDELTFMLAIVTAFNIAFLDDELDKSVPKELNWLYDLISKYPKMTNTIEKMTFSFWDNDKSKDNEIFYDSLSEFHAFAEQYLKELKEYETH